ncbi:tetratricopeptide repeat protein [Methanosarcina sp.]|uniref:tetratricopeptide repeat protein n=1 Tax=Methanosarcina sp. TaxID=2213 RepID=UPI003BB743A9
MSNDPSSDYEMEKRYIDNERVFVDRETCIRAFKDNIQNLETREYNVLFYYGIAGIGKSKLQKWLQKILDDEYPEILWAAINLNTETYREVGTFLIFLRNEIQKKCNAKFYLFNTVHAIYWKKLHPEVPLPKENYPLIKEGGFFSRIIDVLDQFGPARLTWDIINNAPDSVISFFKEQAININKLTAMEAHELEETLPIFFAADFTWYLGTKNSKVYIFIDTYEALWDGLRDKGSFYEKDAWIREKLIPNMPGVSWVICGREKLQLDKHNKGCEIFLESHPLDELPERYCQMFLEDCGIECKEIRDKIIKASEGVPHYLNLSMDTFEKIYKKREPISEDFGKTQPEIFNKFVQYLDRNEIRALEVLSVPNFWDRDLFKILMKEFDTGFPAGAFSELISFSFVKADSNKRYSIHQLMRKSLQEYQDQDDRKDVHKFMFEYYNNKLKDIDIKAITSEYQTALIEAFYHAKEALETEDFFKWFISASHPFKIAAFWQLIVPMYEEMLQIFESKLGMEHITVARTLNHLGTLLLHMDDYEEALPLFERALQIYENTNPQHPDIAGPINNIGEIYRKLGEYEKAHMYFQRALSVQKEDPNQIYADTLKIYGDIALLYENQGEYEKSVLVYRYVLDICSNIKCLEDQDIARILYSLGGLYYDMKDYEEAFTYFQKVLDIQEKIFNPQHLEIAATLKRQAEIYCFWGYYEVALPIYQRVLDIQEKILGQEHPDVASTLNTLATLYRENGNYKKALSLLQRALDIHKKTPDHIDSNCAKLLSNVAEIYRQMGDYKNAVPLFKRSIEIYEQTLDPKNLDITTALHNFTFLYWQMKAYKEALQLCLRLLEIRVEILGLGHTDVASTLKNLKLIYEEMQK